MDGIMEKGTTEPVDLSERPQEAGGDIATTPQEGHRREPLHRRGLPQDLGPFALFCISLDQI
jgi:hypothetical protein